MKKNFKSMVLSILILILAFAVPGYAVTEPAPSKKITQVIAFGDSYSDSGEAKRISSAIVSDPNSPKDAYIKPSDELYWNDRYSNGITAVQVLSEKLNVPLTNYATGGATSGEENYSSWMDYLGNTGVLGQIKTFEKSLTNKKADPDALYFIFASANDYFLFMDYSMPGKVEAVADETVDNIKMAVRRLSKLGATNFLVVNSSDLSLVPYEITTNRTEAAKTFTEHVNKKLPKALNELETVSDVSIQLFDLPKVSHDIMSNPGKYGLLELTKECQSTYPEIKPARENPDQYYFWDEWHYSRVVHKIIGEKLYDEVSNFKIKN